MIGAWAIVDQVKPAAHSDRVGLPPDSTGIDVMKWDEDEDESRNDAHSSHPHHQQNQQQRHLDSPAFSSFGDKSIDSPPFPLQVEFTPSPFLSQWPPGIYHLPHTNGVFPHNHTPFDSIENSLYICTLVNHDSLSTTSHPDSLQDVIPLALLVVSWQRLAWVTAVPP